MKLSPQEVKNRHEQGKLKIALLGMSNIGKSHFAKRLACDYGFKSIEIDAIIQEKLGTDSMEEHAKWLDQPYSDGYAEREDEAMRLESLACNEAMDLCVSGSNSVLDMPGSVIYVDDSVLSRLQSEFWILYIEADKSDIERLKTLYYSSPKPLIWRDSFVRIPNNTPHQSVMKSYPKLLENRAAKYEQLADITLPAQPLFEGEIDIPFLLGIL